VSAVRHPEGFKPNGDFRDITHVLARDLITAHRENPCAAADSRGAADGLRRCAPPDSGDPLLGSG